MYIFSHYINVAFYGLVYGMKRVLILHPALAPYRIDLFNLLSEQCDLLVVFLCPEVRGQKFDSALLESRLRCHYRYLVNGFNVNNHLFRRGIEKIVSDFQPDIIITSEFGVQTVQGICRYRRRRIKIMTMIDDSPAMAVADNWKNRWLKPFLLKRIDGIIVCSEEVKKIYTERFIFPPEKIVICPVLQDADSIREKILSGRDAALSFFQKFRLENRKVVLFVGRLTEVKNLPFLLRGFAAAADEDSKLILVGDGEQKTELEALTRNLKIDDKVVFAGRFDGPELYAWYWLGRLLVLPSTFEPFGAVVNEALAAGMPCLVSKVAGAVSLLAVPETGAVFAPDDVAAFQALMADRLAELPPLTEADLVALPPSLQRCDMKRIVERLGHFLQQA